MSAPSSLRSRWAAFGAAVAVTLGAGGIGFVSAAVTSGDRTVFVAITPCRIMDTRPDFQVGPRNSPVGADETLSIPGIGVVGNCDLPADAVGLVLNVTAIDATLPTFIAVWPAGETRPVASSLNPAPGQPPTPNAVTTDLGVDSSFSIYNLQGTVNVFADVVGYYADHNHDDRYHTKDAVYTKDEVYTKAETDAAIAPAIRTETVIIDPAAFVPAFPNTRVNSVFIWGVYVAAGLATEDQLRAPLALPVGSTIKSVTYRYIDNSTSELAFAIIGSNVSTNGAFGHGAFQSAGAQALPRAATVTSDLLIIANRSYSVQVIATTDWTAAGNSLTVKGVEITYTLP